MKLMARIDRFMDRDRWSIRQKLLFGNLSLVTCMPVVCAVVMYLVSSQWSRSIEQDLEAAGAGVVKSMELVLDNAVIRYVNDITKQNVYQAAREAGLA